MLDKNTFSIKTVENEYTSKVVILATGNKKNTPKNIGIEKYEGKGVSYCAICDGFFYRNKSVSVLGSGEYAISETNDLLNIAKDITILTNGDNAPEFRADNVKVDTREIQEIKGVLDSSQNLEPSLTGVVKKKLDSFKFLLALIIASINPSTSSVFSTSISTAYLESKLAKACFKSFPIESLFPEATTTFFKIGTFDSLSIV